MNYNVANRGTSDIEETRIKDHGLRRIAIYHWGFPSFCRVSDSDSRLAVARLGFQVIDMAKEVLILLLLIFSGMASLAICFMVGDCRRLVANLDRRTERMTRAIERTAHEAKETLDEGDRAAEIITRAKVPWPLSIFLRGR